jgi:hypothetical protein
MVFDQSQLRDLCTQQSFQRGLRYFEEGRVKIKEASCSRIAAVVLGNDSYRVEIDLDRLSARCSCPYDLEGYCKHIVATFLAVEREPEKVDRMVGQVCGELESVQALLVRTDPDAVSDFLLQELESNPEMRARFVAKFSPAGTGKDIKSYRDEIESIFEEAEEDHGWISYGTELDFSPFEELAEIYIQKDDFLEAAKIFQALCETIAGKMDHVDDSDGYFGSNFSSSLQAFVECILGAELTATEKSRCIDYLWRRYLLNEPDYFQDDYLDALKVLCNAKEDLVYWKEILLPHLPAKVPDSREDRRGHYQAKKLISIELHLLSCLKETDSFYALMDEQYRTSPDLCLEYAQQLLRDKDRLKAISVAEEGIAAFPESSSIYLREFLIENYRGSDPDKYREQLLSLFFLRGDWKHYERLKKESSSLEQWQETLNKIIAKFSGKGYGRARLIEVYLREQMYDAALKAVIGQKSIPELSQYHKRLAEMYPKEYFGAYRELISPYAECRMGRDHYREVASILKDMKAIAGFEAEAQEILERLRKENKRKPAFIDELKKL